MNRLFATAFGVVLALVVTAQVFAQNQVTVRGTLYQSGVPQITVIDQDHWVAVEDLKGVKIDTSSGSGPLTDMSSDNKLILFGEKNVVHFHGYMTFMDKEGDKMVWETWDDPAAGPEKGMGKIVASTGKFAGMEGTIETTFVVLPDFKDGGRYSIGYCVEKMTFKNPL